MKQRYSTASFREKSVEDVGVGDLGMSGSIEGCEVWKVKSPKAVEETGSPEDV